MKKIKLKAILFVKVLFLLIMSIVLLCLSPLLYILDLLTDHKHLIELNFLRTFEECLAEYRRELEDIKNDSM